MRENISKGVHEQKISKEIARVQNADQIMKELEAKEQAIIERLKNTQINENKMREMLVNAIMLTAKGKKQRVKDKNGESANNTGNANSNS